MNANITVKNAKLKIEIQLYKYNVTGLTSDTNIKNGKKLFNMQ